MEVVKHFTGNFKAYFSGEIEHEEFSSLTIRNIMVSMGIWRPPLTRERSIFPYILTFLPYSMCLSMCFSGYPRQADIPEWGKFIDIIAGVELSLAKLLFLYWNRDELITLIDLMNVKSLELKERGQHNRHIKDMRDSFYFQEMVVFLFTNAFAILFSVLIYLQVLFERPFQLVVPVSLDGKEILKGPGRTYWIIYVTQVCLCPYVALILTLCDVMIGNIYNQFILHLEVLGHDLRTLDLDDKASSAVLVAKFSEFSKTYQSLRELNKHCERCMRPFFINNIFATVMATTFSCVEIGIMVNVDPKQCIKPATYFLFISFPFFYWCWLGNRVNEKSTALAQDAFIYKERSSTVFNEKLQLLFTHMVQEPLTINAKPFFVLNFEIFVTVMKVAYQFTAVFKNFYK